MNKQLHFLLPLVICQVCLLASCSKKNSAAQPNADFFPPVLVDFYVNLALPLSLPLQNPQGWIYDSHGYRGLVIYNTGFGGDNNYVAFDRTCPYKTDSSCSFISVDSTSLFYVCGQYSPKFKPCCNSKFSATNGGQVAGPATRGLKQYYVRQEGNSLHISSTPLQ